jgi:uncharacterized cupredoxin-like copper-binding protein
MTTIATVFSATMVALAVSVAAPSIAAENPTVVKVALTDMSASAGMGPMGQMMMSPGYGRGQGNTGRGMMRPGYGWGPGTTGSGYGYGYGPNMMMGMMAIRIDQDSVKAGPVMFDVTNWSRYLPHEVLIVAVDNAAAPLPYDYDEAKVNEDQVKVLGDTSELLPNKSASVKVTLVPGSYLLICNVPGHYAAGMAVPLMVKP